MNRKCLDSVNTYIEEAIGGGDRLLILINGVPGAGKTAVGQSIVFERNQGGKANAVYLSGNGPLVEVLQYQIDRVGGNAHIAENAIQGMKEFKTEYFSTRTRQNTRVPEQSILIFDEAQRAWDVEKMKRGFSEPEGLLDVGERIYEERGYAVVIGLYGNGQAIYEGEEQGIDLWHDALLEHEDWIVVASSSIASELQDLEKEERLIEDNDVFLSVSLRADFIDCSKWVEQAICMKNASLEDAREELAELQNTSLRIMLTRDISRVRAYAAAIAEDHPDWKYGFLVSNFADQNIIQSALPGWNIGYRGRNAVNFGEYGPWFTGGCNSLQKACSVYGNQGLELDCPIVLFGGGYIRNDGRWIPRYSYASQRDRFEDPDTIVENNFRVLLTRARKEMILVIPSDPIMDETYQFFLDMGMDLL